MLQLQPGARIRIFTHEADGSRLLAMPRIEGVLHDATAESLWIDGSRGRGLTPVPVNAVRRLDLNTGHTRGSGAVVGIISGAFIGLAAGLGAGLLGRQTDNQALVAFGYVGFSLGVSGGAVVGAAVGRDRWERVW